VKRLVLCVVLAACANAQTNSSSKPAVTPADYGKWETLGASVLSPDGKWIAYSIRRVEGTHELRVTPAAGGATTVLASGANPAFSSDSRWLAYAITQSEAEADRARGRAGAAATAGPTRRPAQNKLGILDLSTGAKTAVDDVQSFSFSDQEVFLAFQRYAPQRPTAPGGAAAPSDRPSDVSPDPAGSTLTIRNLANGNDVTFGNVTSFAWQDKGTRIAMTIGAEGRAGNGLNVFDPAKGDLKIMDSGQAIFTGVAWRKDSSDLAALRSRKDGQYEGESYTVLAWKNLGEKRFTDAPVGKRVVAARTPQWSDDGRTLFVGLADWDRKAEAVKGDGDPSNVEIWHARDVNVISEQKLRIARDRDRNALAAWNLEANKLVALSTNPKENVQLPRQGNRALAVDESPYETDGMFGRRYVDVSKVEISTGNRTQVVRRLVPPVWFSPGGRYALNFLDGEYTIYDIENGTQRNVSKEARVNFTNKADDYPVRHKPPYGVAGWTKDDASVIVYDETDLWQLFPDGAKPQRLTDGAADQLRHRYVDVRDSAGGGFGGGPRFGGGREEAIDLSKPVYLSLYGIWNKQSGYARLMNGKVERSVLLDKSVGRLMKAKSGDTYVYTSEAFDDSPDIFVAAADLKNAKQISETNPFAAQYAWGRSTLVDYKSPRGERLQGALIYPANYEAGKQYPMIVHIYERESQLLHRYTVPSERSPYNAAAWSARGYFVFMPDIVFRPREPGMSVVECVTAATKAVIATGMVDPKRIGLIGHSWGGFGTAFVLTQTDMFAAGAAGGPLTNLVSSYGEIYWNTGVPETSHAEVGQERMEVPLWEDPGAYIRNSAVFSVNKMRNPLLLCVGDKDGASDWHQDLELYNLARRAGKQVVLLVYPGENHGLAVKANQIDYHRRINAWFDTYLKGNDSPAWISKGVSVLEREKELKQMKKDGPAAAPTGGGAIEP